MNDESFKVSFSQPHDTAQVVGGWASADTLSVGDDSEHRFSSMSLALSITPRRGRALAGSVLMLMILVTLMLVFLNGFSLLDFDSFDKTLAERNKLTDNYNSYSANVASIFSKPIEIFTTLAVQIVILAFLADSLATPSPSWKLGMVTLAIGAGIGYLVRNGISALNVQLRPYDIRPFVGYQDLSTQNNESLTLDDSELVTNVGLVYSETMQNNTIANTVLRNLVRPLSVREAAVCSTGDSADEQVDYIPDSFLQLGIPQRDWQNQVVHNALVPTKYARFVVNSTNASEPTTTSPGADLPMNASRAADLFLYGMVEATRNLPWGKALAFVDQDAWATRFPLTLTTGREVRSDMGSMADFTNLLPPESQHADESTQRAWFLKQLSPAVARQFNTSDNTSCTDIQLEFAHFDLSPSIQFDALTFEVDVDPIFYTDYTRNDTGQRYKNIDMPKSCSLWPGMCLFNKPKYTVSTSEFDPPAQIRVFSPCVDELGNEKITFMLNQTVRGFFPQLSCSQRSNSSMYVVSIGKRLVADTITQNQTVDSTGISNSTAGAIVTDLRKIYSFTIGRLAWELTDLAKAFHAECGVTTSSNKCMGLQFPLGVTANDSSASQHLVVGADALPMAMLTPYEQFLDARPRMITLAHLFEPNPMDVSDGSSTYVTGDILLPHNIRNITWDYYESKTPFRCSVPVEDRLRVNLNNHFYSEHSLQPAYTAATYFLFQNAIVREAVPLHGNVHTLAFTGNAQEVAVLLSIPAQNAWLTLAGCMVLVIGLAVALSKPSGASDPLQNITAPQAIARVLLDEKQFPPQLLHRRVVGHEVAEMETLVVSSIALEAKAVAKTSHPSHVSSPAA